MSTKFERCDASIREVGIAPGLEAGVGAAGGTGPPRGIEISVSVTLKNALGVPGFAPNAIE
jgi:hypothetical protein